MNYTAPQEITMSEIKNELSDIESLNPSQIVNKLQTIVNCGFEPHIIQIIRTCIQFYQKDRGILKYAHIADKLLKLPVWNQVMQNVIVQFFCDIFIFLLTQKCYHQIDELKIIRKFWLKTIHPRHLQAMKDIILAETGNDIDQFFKPDAIALLKQHYEKKLKLNPQQMAFHLPQTIKTSNSIYENRTQKPQPQQFLQNPNYLITQPLNPPPVLINQNLYPTNVRISPQPVNNFPHLPYNRSPYAPIQPQQFYPNNQFLENDPFRMKVKFTTKKQANFPQRVSPPLEIRDPRMVMPKNYYPPQSIIAQRENVPIFPEQTTFNRETLKRERLYSEQTRTPNSSEYVANQNQLYHMQNYPKVPYEPYVPYEANEMTSQPAKKVHYNEQYEAFNKQVGKIQKVQQKPRHLKILQMLRNDKVYNCKQCGKGYKSMGEYEKHLAEHFEQKLALREKKNQRIRLLSYDEWTQKGSGRSLQQLDQFYITVSNLTPQSEQNQSNLFFHIQDCQALYLKCKLCNEPFDLKFIQDQWVLSNATHCEIDGQLAPMHKTCQEALEESSYEELL